MAAASAKDGALATSMTTPAPASASVRPSPVMVLTPVLGAAAMTSWPSWRRLDTTLLPMRPVPPITTIFIATSPFGAMLREWPMLRDKTLSACPNCLGFPSKAGRGHVGSGQGDVGPSTGREETLSERASGQIVLLAPLQYRAAPVVKRSEERRVGKECGRTCRAGGEPGQ